MVLEKKEGYWGGRSMAWGMRAQTPQDHGTTDLQVVLTLTLRDDEVGGIVLDPKEYHESAWFTPTDVLMPGAFHPALQFAVRRGEPFRAVLSNGYSVVRSVVQRVLSPKSTETFATVPQPVPRRRRRSWRSATRPHTHNQASRHHFVFKKALKKKNAMCSVHVYYIGTKYKSILCTLCQVLGVCSRCR